MTKKSQGTLFLGKQNRANIVGFQLNTTELSLIGPYLSGKVAPTTGILLLENYSRVLVTGRERFN